MKKFIYPLLSILFISLSSCDEVDKLTEQDIDISFETSNMTIAPPGMKAPQEGYDFLVTNEIDILGNPDIAEYLEHIEDWDLNSITITVVSVSEENTVFMAGSTLTVKNDFNSATLTYDMDFPVVEGAVETIDGVFLDEVEDVLADEENLIIEFEGGLNNQATVVLKVSLDVTITVDVI